MVDHLALALGTRAEESEADVKVEMKKHLVNYFPCCVTYWAPGGPFGKAGQPDLMMTWRGVSIHIEVKRPDKKPTDLQMARLRNHVKAGGISAYIAGKVEIWPKLKFIKDEVLRRTPDYVQN